MVNQLKLKNRWRSSSPTFKGSRCVCTRLMVFGLLTFQDFGRGWGVMIHQFISRWLQWDSLLTQIKPVPTRNSINLKETLLFLSISLAKLFFRYKSRTSGSFFKALVKKKRKWKILTATLLLWAGFFFLWREEKKGEVLEGVVTVIYIYGLCRHLGRCYPGGLCWGFQKHSPFLQLSINRHWLTLIEPHRACVMWFQPFKRVGSTLELENPWGKRNTNPQKVK